MRTSVVKHISWLMRNMRRGVTLTAWFLSGQFSRAKIASRPYQRRLLKVIGPGRSGTRRIRNKPPRRARRDASYTAVEYLDVKRLNALDRPQRTDIIVLMPCIDTSVGMKTAQLLATRAGIDCEIFVIDDTLRQGFVRTVNEAAIKLSSTYVVYLAQDAYPGRDWLRRAYEAMEKTGAGLLGFNDGKSYGRIAAFGMVRTDWVKRLYDGPIFYPGYKSHAADNELTVIARAARMYIYEPNCVLMEFDPEKEAKNHIRNKNDGALFKERFVRGFDGLVSTRAVAKMADEYGVRLPIDSRRR